MKFRIVECKNNYGQIRYKIQYRFLYLWWRDYKTPFITSYHVPFGELVDCAFSHEKYNYDKDKKYRSLYYSVDEFHSIEQAEKELERFLTKYEYKSIPIYPACFNKYYVLYWGDYKRFDIFGTYEECCNDIDRKLALIEDYKEKKIKEQEEKARQKEYKKHKNIIKTIDKKS